MSHQRAKQRGKKGSITSYIFPVIGGYGMSFVNKYTKRAFYDIWTNIIVNRNGRNSDLQSTSLQSIPASENSDQSLSLVDKMLIFHRIYQSWSIEYDEKNHPFTAYICTKSGFFNLSLCSGQILKAYPSSQPKLSTRIKEICDRLNDAKKSEAGPDISEKLVNVQCICLINMILKDFYAISTVLEKEEYPLLLRIIMDRLSRIEKEKKNIVLKDILTNVLSTQDISREILMRFKDYIIRYSAKLKQKTGKELFYREYPFGNTSSADNQNENEESQINIIGKMGMDLTWDCNKSFKLFLTDVDKDQESIDGPSILSTGHWSNIFQMHYCITIPTS
jgi:hypothetical protein